MSLSLIEEIELRIAEVQAVEPFAAEFERLKELPNRAQVDSTIFEDDEDRWSLDD